MKTKPYRASFDSVFTQLHIYRPFFKRKVKTMLGNRNFIVSLGCVGLFANLFVLLAGKSLTPFAGDMFQTGGFVVFALSVLLYITHSETDNDKERERNQTYRDIDNVYRYVDDSVRDLRDELKEANRSHCCETKTSRK